MLLLNLHDRAINSPWVNKYLLLLNVLASHGQADGKNGYLITSLLSTVFSDAWVAFALKSAAGFPEDLQQIHPPSTQKTQ